MSSPWWGYGYRPLALPRRDIGERRATLNITLYTPDYAWAFCWVYSSPHLDSDCELKQGETLVLGGTILTQSQTWCTALDFQGKYNPIGTMARPQMSMGMMSQARCIVTIILVEERILRTGVLPCYDSSRDGGSAISDGKFCSCDLKWRESWKPHIIRYIYEYRVWKWKYLQ